MKNLKTVALSVIATTGILLGLVWFILGSKVSISTPNDVTNSIETDTTHLPKIIPISNGSMTDLIEGNDGILFINLWASWCKPCIAEMPAIVELRKKYPAIKFIMISSDMENEDRLLKSSRILHQNGIDFPTYVIEGGNKLDIMSRKKAEEFMKGLTPEFQNNPGYPYTIVQKNGEILYEGVGTEDNIFETYIHYDNLFQDLLSKENGNEDSPS